MSTTINKDMSLNHELEELVRNKKYEIDVLAPKTYSERLLNMELFEKVIDNIDDLQDFISLCYDGKTCSRADWMTTKTILRDLFNKRKKSTSVLYAPIKKSPNGRHFSKEKSLQGLSRTIRHLICHENYKDIDIVNCHPVILVQLCRVYNFECSHIEFYQNNRNKCLDELMTITKFSKDDVKQSMLSLLNGGSCNKIFNNFEVPDWFRNFAIQIEKIHNMFASHDDLKQFRKEVIKAHGEDCFNLNGKICNKLLCQFENIIIQHAIQFCEINGITVASPQFDGILCENNDKISDDFLIQMSQFIQSKVGLEVQFSLKEMKEHLPLLEKLGNMKTKKEIREDKKKAETREYFLKKEQKELEKIRKQEEKRMKELPLPNCSDECLGKVFLERIGDNIMFHKGLNQFFIYNESVRLWQDVQLEASITLFSEILLPYIDELILDCENNTLLDRYEKMKDTICSTKKQVDILKQIKHRLNDYSTFIDDHFDKAEHLFPFQDKVVDFKDLSIRKREREDYFTKTTNNDYLEILSQDEKDKVYTYLKEILLPKGENDIEYIENFLLLMSHLLTDDNSIKKIITFIGGNDGGKSLLGKLCQNTLQDFSVIAPKRLIVKSKAESVLNTEMMPLVGKRVFFISELSENEQYNETLLKNISGDDKEFPVRASADKGYSKVIVRAKGIILTNESANYSNAAFISRLLYINFPNKFKQNSDKLKEILGLQNIFFTILCHKAHELISNKFVFVPHERMIKATKLENDSKDTVKLFFEENYVFTNDRKDKLLRSSLFTDYTYYCKENELRKVSKKIFLNTISNEPYNFNKENKDKCRIVDGYDYICCIKKLDLFQNPTHDIEEERDHESILMGSV